MKKISFISLALIAGYCAQAQNTLPQNGNVGIGTTNPSTLAEIKKTFASGSQGVDFLRLTSSQAGAWFSQLGLQFRWEDTGNGVAFNLAQVTASPNWPGGLQSGGDLQFWTKSLNVSTESELTEKMRVTASGNVGIGLTNPTHKLDVIGQINVVGQSGGFATGDIPKLSFGSSDTEFSEFSLPYGGPLEYKAFHGHVFKTYGNASSAVERMRIDINGNVGVGTLTPQEKLSVNGKIRAHEIKVETANWPDYVFAKSYQLPTLQETEKHIKEKGHLPGIPSAMEVKANGVDLGEMNAKLLQKIEELTLHLIEMKKDNNQLKQMYQQQQQQIDNLNRKN